MNDTNLPTVEQLLEAADCKVKELVRAIHCLPKPPEGMGDGPDERVANVIFLLQKARDERERVREICAVVCKEAGDRAGSVARDLEKAGLVANSFRAEQEGLLSAGRRILELDLTKDLAASNRKESETKR